MSSCTLEGHLNCPDELRDVLETMISDPQLHSLCDVALIVQDERFMAHKAVLAAASPVFKAMFTNCMKERDSQEIVLSCVRKDAWRMVMQYIYNAQVNMDDENDALALLSTARMYQLERLESLVEVFLMEQAEPKNALLLLNAAMTYDLQRLADVCFTVMAMEFEMIRLSPAFLGCPIDIVARLLSYNSLMVKSELTVFETVIRWVCVGEGNERKSHLERLLSLIRLERLTDIEVKTVARHELAQSSERFRERIFKRLVMDNNDVINMGTVGKSHLKLRRRDSTVFTFTHMQRPIGNVPQADMEEVVRTPWCADQSGTRVWRLKIYPHGYHKAKGQFLSMYIQGRSTFASEQLDVVALFDIFLINRLDEAMTILFSSTHHFRDTNDHWGFHRFLQLPQLLDHEAGFFDTETDSIIVGATIYF